MASVNDVFRVAARSTNNSLLDIINVYHFRVSVLNDSDDETIADELVARVSSMYQDLESHCADGVDGVDMSVQNMTSGLVLGSQGWSPTFESSAAGDRLPDGCAALVYARTGVSRRIGRKFLGVFVEGLQASGNWTGTLLTALATFGAMYISGWNGTSTNSYEPGVYDKEAAVFRTFTEYVVSGIVAYQRRRKRGVGS